MSGLDLLVMHGFNFISVTRHISFCPMPPTAGVLQDYIGVPSPSTFTYSGTNSQPMCTTIPISDNQVLEETIEDFFVNLALSTAVERVSIDPDRAQVNILDNDRKCRT